MSDQQPPADVRHEWATKTCGHPEDFRGLPPTTFKAACFCGQNYACPTCGFGAMSHPHACQPPADDQGHSYEPSLGMGPCVQCGMPGDRHPESPDDDDFYLPLPPTTRREYVMVPKDEYERLMKPPDDDQDRAVRRPARRLRIGMEPIARATLAEQERDEAEAVLQATEARADAAEQAGRNLRAALEGPYRVGIDRRDPYYTVEAEHVEAFDAALGGPAGPGEG